MQFDLLFCLIVSCIGLTGAVSPDVVAPDSNNIRTEFSPDDSAAGAMDTSLDNQNATPLVILAPPATTSTTSTTTTTTTTTTTQPTTTSSTTTPAPTTTTSSTTTTTSTTTTSTTPKPTTTTTTTTTPKPTTTTTTTKSTTPVTQRPNPPTTLAPLPPSTQQPVITSGYIFNPNPYGPFPSIYDPSQPSIWPQRPGGRFNIPWWMLLFEEI